MAPGRTLGTGQARWHSYLASALAPAPRRAGGRAPALGDNRDGRAHAIRRREPQRRLTRPGAEPYVEEIRIPGDPVPYPAGRHERGQGRGRRAGPGAFLVLRCAGRDGNKLFGEVHPWVNYETMLAACLVGLLVEEGDDQNKMEEMD